MLPWFYSGDDTIHRIHDLAWGGMGGILFAVGALTLLRRPAQKVAPMQQIVAVQVAFILAFALATDFDPFVLIFVVVIGAMAVLHPAREQLLRAGRPSPVLAGLTVLAAIPLIGYALGQGELARADTVSEHADLNHWTGMAALAFALILVGLVASFRAKGRRITAWGAGAAAALFGLGSLIYPDAPSSAGEAWGIVAIAGGLLFVAAAEWEARRRT